MSVITRLKDVEDKIYLQSAFKSRIKRKRRIADFFARLVVTSGGIAIILSILAILFFITIEVIPLWKGVKADLSGRFDVKDSAGRGASLLDKTAIKNIIPTLGIGLDEYREIGFIITKTGKINFISLKDGSIIKQVPLSKIEGKNVSSIFESSNNKQYALGTEDGYVLPVEINFKVSFTQEGKRIIEPRLFEGEPFLVESITLNKLAYNQSSDDSRAAAVITSDGRLIFVSEETSSSLIGDEIKNLFKHDLTSGLKGDNVTSLELDSFLDNLYVGTKEGRLYHWSVSDKQNPKLVDVISATAPPGTPLTALGFLLGDRSLIVGDASGVVSVWFQVEDETSPIGRKLQKIHEFKSHNQPITNIASSSRDRSFLSADSSGNISLHHATSNQTLLQLSAEGSSIVAIAFAPKANGILAIDQKGVFYDWDIDNPHPETNLKTLFGKVWYEGYSEPEYVWQSTGGTDEFEPKLSLTPLAYGTLKGAFYALIFAIPLSILGAICVSQFMHPSMRNVIKPIIEIMAALPSVVLGFFAGLWLAPYIEKVIPAVFLMPLVITILTLVAMILWKYLPKFIHARFREGTEFFLLIPIIILGILISLWLNTPLENMLFGGDYKNWLFEVLGLQYDQRNALIVGFAMGFAVIPIIFSIAEDALSNVPNHLTAGSLALGANRWQTAIKVVLPTASAGILSAIMIGLGRAVGETMIVLMATGNTPIMDWSIFNGFRALSANIAVEIPEAPHGGTLYRVLFLAALLLFFVTFVLNTAAELVRQRLRKKYGQL